MSTPKDIFPTIDNTGPSDGLGSPNPHTSDINKRKREHEDDARQALPRKRHNSTNGDQVSRYSYIDQTSRHPSINQSSDTPSINPADLTRTFPLPSNNTPKPSIITTSSLLSYPHPLPNTYPPQKLQKSQTNVGMKHKRQQVTLRLWIWVAMLRSHCRDLGILNAEHEKNIKEMEALVVEYGGYVITS
jgi:hypothetical protein